VAALLGQLYRDLGDHAHGDALLTRALALSYDAHVPDDVRARVLVNVAALESEAKEEFDASLAHARQAVALLEAVPERNAEDIAKAHWIIAWDLINLGDNEGAIALLRRTAPADQATLGDRSEPVAEQWVKLGIALGKGSRYDEAAVAFDKATQIMRDIYGENSNHVAHVLNESAIMYLNAGDYARAEEALRKAWKIHLDTLGPEHPDTLSALHNLLGSIEGSGRYAEALPQRLQLAQQAKSSTTDVSPIKAANQCDAASNDYRELGRFAEANAMSEQALALLEQAQGARSARSVTARSHLATTLQLQGRYPESDAVFHEALAISLEHGSLTSFSACGLRQKIGQNLRLEHHHAEAIEQLQALTQDACLQSLKENDQWRPSVLAALSEAQLDSGDVAGANLTAESAMAYARKAFPLRHFRLGIELFALARAKLAAGEPAQAELLLREALTIRTPPHPFDDPRVLEVKVALVNALTAQDKTDEARSLTAEVEPPLSASRSPYAADLRTRLTAR
jgi:serine/threonine-protein kinase